MKRTRSRVTFALASAAGSLALGCASVPTVQSAAARRALAATLIPKLDLHVELERSRESDAPDPRDPIDERARWLVGASLRWHSSVGAASVPERYELAPSALSSPCELEDVTCLAEQAEVDAELASALQEVQ